MRLPLPSLRDWHSAAVGTALLACAAAAPLAGQDPASATALRPLSAVIPRGQQLEVIAERRFDAASGLRASTVFALALDRNGLPLIGADDGLYVYAGGSWRREPLPAAFQNQQVRSLLLPAAGGRWVGTRQGVLFRPRGGRWRHFAERDGLAGGVVFSLVQSRAIDGTPRVVAGTAGGVSYFNGTTFVRLPLPAGMRPVGMMVAEGTAPDGSPELWAASAAGGLARLNRGQWTLYGAPEGLTSPDVQAVLAVPGGSGGRVFAMGAAGIFVLDRARGSTRFALVPGSPRDIYRAAPVQVDGDVPELWVGRRNGEIWRQRAGEWRVVSSSISERHGTVTLLETVPGHGGGFAVYASARSGYLARLSRGVAGALALSQQDAATSMNTLYAEAGGDGRDALWLGTTDRGVLRLADDGGMQRVPFSGGAPARWASQLTRLSLAPPGEGDTASTADAALVAVADDVPWRLTGARFERFDEGLDGARVLRLARVPVPDGREALLAGTSSGVRLWTGARWQPLWPTVRGPVTAFAWGEQGSARVVYLGGGQEVRTVTGASVVVEPFTPVATAPAAGAAVRALCTSRINGESRVFALHMVRGVLWRRAGNGTWSTLPPTLTRPMSTVGISDMACLPDGQLALATSTGLTVLDLAAPTTDKWHVGTQVSDADGLPNNAVLSLAPSAAARNLLWVGTSFGVGLVDLSRAAQLPPARLTVRVSAEARDRVVGEGDVLGADENDIHVDPMLLTFHREELTRYRVRLRGQATWPSPTANVRNDSAEGEWLDLPNRFYHDLAPGKYELTVWAYDWAGREYGPVQRRFSMLTPNWQTWPARIVFALWVALLLTVAYRWRVRTIRENALQLLASERRARDSEGRFRAIFEQALDSHLLLEDGKVQAGNAEAARLFGVPAPDALVGRTLGELLGDVSLDARAMSSGETIVQTGRQVTPVHYTVTEVPSADRVLRHVVVRDLTEVRKAEAEREWFQAQVREAQKLESLGTLAGGVAHDFNNLLGVIRGNAELARTALRRNRSNDENLGAILDASDRARDVVRQILTFSRRSTPTREYVNLSRLVLDLQPLLRRMIPRTVQLQIEGAETSRLIMGDPTQLQQLLLNLVSNAEYAMRNTTNGLLTIALSGRDVPEGQPAPTGRTVVLQVRDTGAGMSEDVRSRVFEPFFTTKPTGEGTGLGMAVVHGIVTSHAGRADVFSAVGEGTTFEIRFPLAVIEDLWDEGLDPALHGFDEAEMREPVADDATTAGTGGVIAHAAGELDVLDESPFAGTTIVVVDDEPAVAQVVERALQHYGHIVHVFHNPELALRFIQEQPSAVDLLITDQTMPGLTGDLLAESVHLLRSDLPVLILTGFSHRLTPERIATARAHAVLLKPVELDELKRRVDDALALTQRR